MKLIKVLLCAVILSPIVRADTPVAAPAPAAVAVTPALASPESVEKLLEILQLKKLVESLPGQMTQMSKSAQAQIYAGEHLTPEQQKTAEDINAKVLADVTSELSWDTLKGLYIEVYTKNFTQDEIDAAIAFYQTPAGQSFVKKQPAVMQQAVIAMQGRIIPIIKKLRQTVQDSVTQAKALQPAPAVAAPDAAAPAAPAPAAGK
jgi:hypothetical protein